MNSTAVNVLIGAAGALATGLGVWLAWYAGRKSERAIANQNRIAAQAVAQDWRRDVRCWADEAVNGLAEASYACVNEDENGADCKEQIHSARSKLSALIDRGRFFFPNIPADGMGNHKPAAYRGWRHAVLDPLVAAERILAGKGHGHFETREHALIEMRREFVSSVQGVLSPQSQNQEIARMISDAGAEVRNDPTFGGLLPDSKTTPSGAERLLWATRKKTW